MDGAGLPQQLFNFKEGPVYGVMYTVLEIIQTGLAHIPEFLQSGRSETFLPDLAKYMLNQMVNLHGHQM